ncbi:MAG: M23 family metallopeptidase [Enhydrobacter sp.]|nr:M23 family metallopeptidase [Enhydrobacter sp.]
MAITTTREQRGDRPQVMRAFLAVTVAVSTLGLFASASAVAQIKAPSKQHLKHGPRAAAAKPSPTDNQADQLNEKWLNEFNKEKVEAPSAAPAAAAAGAAGGASSATGEPDDERLSSVPSMASLPGASARTVVPGSIKYIKASGFSGFSTVPSASVQPSLKHLSDAFTGYSAGNSKIDLYEGRTGDGATRLLVASIGDGKSKQSYWWFAPLDQPEGWFDENGRRLGGAALGEPKPGSRMSSPFGTRRYYGRRSGAGFHNGIDFEGKTGEPILAAADGVINHQGWYYNYGRTVKISHADNFETLYAHMSRFESSVAPGSRVRKGDVIGYIGSTGRSSGAHLHFSIIVDGRFVDPAPYITSGGGMNALSGNSLVAFRQWQQDVHAATGSQRNRSSWGGGNSAAAGGDPKL